MSRRPRRRLIPSATALAPLLDSWKNRSLGAGAAQVGDALHPKRTPLQPLFTERAEMAPHLHFYRSPNGIRTRVFTLRVSSGGRTGGNPAEPHAVRPARL